MPTHDIIDNRTHRLVDFIQTTLPGSQSAKFAVGYFFLSGLEAVEEQLANVQELRLLIGNTSSRQTIEQIAEGYRRLEQVQDAAEALAFPKRQAMTRFAQNTARNIGEAVALMDQTEQAERIVGTLIRLIEQDRLKVRVYTKGRLHAKAYIFDYGPIYDAQGRPLPRPEKGIAIAGSSNFTLSGVTSNTELNVVVQGNDNHAELTRWFEELWQESQDFKSHLMLELRQAWPLTQVTPYEIYLKTLYDLVRDILEGDETTEFLWRDEITAVLTEFQERAVRQAVHMIHRYGGCFVADVVGLGKSYIGAAIVKYFERHNEARPLIICPAPLVEMWEHYNEAYQLNARVLSMGLLREHKELGPEWMLYDDRFSRRDFVLVDESHNFRHTDSQRYRVLQTYLSAAKRRCVFLTATPRNKSVWDIYNQLKLFHPDDRTDLPINPANLREYLGLVEKGTKQLPALMAHLLIRRTRNQILRWYGYDSQTEQRVNPDRFRPYREGKKKAYILVGGRKHFFPKRSLETIEYSIADTYQGLYQQLRGYLGRRRRRDADPEPGKLTYARYGLWHYVRPEKRNQQPYVELERVGANLRGLMRVLLFKRFESSVHAFCETIRRLLHTHQAFLLALKEGIVAAGEQARRILYESDQDEEQALIDALSQVSERYKLEDFDAAALRAAIEHDIQVLEQVLALVEPITPDRDAKLQTLKAWLARPPLNQGKCLIFTQYADTARYLYETLDPGGQRPEIKVIYSREKSKAEIVGRFAPQANPAHRPPEGTPEIELLVATDVLSEGLNLQDCDKVINYDLHWNPVRLIQRFGRIDRIGTEHDVIYAYNFLPETELETHLGLREKLEQRIREIHETIGEDAAILDPSEQLNEKAMYTIYTKGDIDRYEEDDVDEYVDLNEAIEIIRQLKEDQPELYQQISQLADGIRCGRRIGQKGAIVFCRAGRYRQLFHLDESGEIISRDVSQILSLLKCDPDTPAEPLAPNHNQAVMQTKRLFDQEVRARRAEQKHVVSLTRAQQFIRRELQVLYKIAEPDLQAQISLMELVFTQPSSRPAVNSALNRVHKEKLTGLALLDRLSNIYRAFRLEQPESAEQQASDENDELARIVCSESLRPQT